MTNYNKSRRTFLQKSALASSSVFVPQFLQGLNPQSISDKTGKSLVVIQWSGGNDGLNTLVPFQNDLYYKNRPSIAIQKNKVLKLNDELGFNPIMPEMRELYDQGLLSIINNVGYPNPDRSHFRSMDIWHTASDSNEYLTTGWLGRYLDKYANEKMAYNALEVDDTLSLALKGKYNNGFAASNPERLKNAANRKFHKAIVQHHHEHDHDENVAYLYKTLIDTQDSANYLHKQSKIYTTKVKYPKSAIAKELKLIADLIISGTNTEIYYANMGGFDTHANQKSQQERRLKEYSQAVAAFIKDLKQNDKLDDTLVMTFSEFGRRVKQNASRGTDHGAANNVYLMGGKLKKAGIYNEAPNLGDLDKGDLIYSIDFRQIYATILKNWLGVKSKPVLGGQQFKTLDFI
jgi:uncharacterized protein (DUF1501 family)